MTGEAKPVAFELVVENRYRTIRFPPSLDADASEDRGEEKVKKEEEGETEEQESSPEPLFDCPKTPKRKVRLNYSSPLSDKLIPPFLNSSLVFSSAAPFSLTLRSPLPPPPSKSPEPTSPSAHATTTTSLPRRPYEE